LRRATILLGAIAVIAACASPPPPPPPRPVVKGPPTDTVRIPLTDLLTGTYFGNQGGLYPGGINQPPPDHDSAVKARRNAIKPLDVNGDESPFGKYVLLSIGRSNATQEWCSATTRPPCAPWTLMGRAASDPTVNHYTMVIVNGADSGRQDAHAWASATSANYERIKTARLTPLGLSENQVQIVWAELDDLYPVNALPADSSDANVLMLNLGQVMRALRVRYPHLQLVFLSSRLYAGYATTDLSPEPYAYEQGFALKWLIESQIKELRGSAPHPSVGSLNYVKKTAAVVLWGPYMWAAGETPRSDGTLWRRTDFEQDGTTPSQDGENKVGFALLNFFKSSPYTRCWFVNGQYCL
jgi:hypothetical protein